MGKIRDTFRLVVEERPEGVTTVTPPGLALPADEGPAEVPFIEIGPRRQMEASADVMACPGPTTQPFQRPHHVFFRTLAQAKPSRVAAELVAYHAPADPVSHQYADLLKKATDSADGGGLTEAKVFLFTGVRSGVRSTTVLLNLALTAARQRKRAIVVDANLRRPAVAARLGLEVAPGLAEVLAGDVALATALRASPQDGLRVLTSGAPTGLWLDADEFRRLLLTLTNEADLVFVDGPCWDGRAGVTACAAACQVVFLVLPSAEADTPFANDLVRGLPAKGINLAGCILTGG